VKNWPTKGSLLNPLARAEIAVPIKGIDVNIVVIAVASVPDY
jgi:hypothetical protein